ncbi:MAG: autotransporter domain-containing protein [Alcaligenaceae bacterium]|nr:autotransporter domain-containing protein [Alcaligenaceae bacterium]
MAAAAKLIKHRLLLVWRTTTVPVFALGGFIHGPVLADDCPSGGYCYIYNKTINVSDEKREFTGLSVGLLGPGALDINQAQVHVDGYVQLQEGTVRVHGDAAELVSRFDLNIGLNGGGSTGQLEISEGGRVITRGNAKIGHIFDSGGIVNVSGNNTRWEIDDFLYVGDEEYSRGELTINQGAVVSIGEHAGNHETVKVGRQVGSTGIINIGAKAGANAVAGGTLNADSLVFGAGNGTLVFNHTAPSSDGLIFAPVITSAGSPDSGAIRHENGHTILTGNNSGFTGTTTLDGGTLVLGHDNALGTGRLVVTGALQEGRPTLQAGLPSSKISNDIRLERPVGLPFASYLTISGNNDLELSGRLSGDGLLNKLGTGTLTLSGNNTDFRGMVYLRQGTLRVAHNQALGSKTLDINGGTLDYANGIELSTDIDALISSSFNLHVGDGAFATQSGRIRSTSTSSARKTGSGTLRLTNGSMPYEGAMIIDSGTLLVDGSLAQSKLLTVNSGGKLGGSGIVGNTTVMNGGTLAPGNSIGTLTVNGDLVFDSGSRFEVEVNPQGTDSDRVDVTGNVTLNGGTVAHIGLHGDYDLRSNHTILTVGGTLTGAFDAVTSDFAFLTPQLLYDYGARTVGLQLARNQRGFASAPLTRNQAETAHAIDSIGLQAGHAVYDAIAQLPDDENLMRRSFDALSGEIHASTKTALIEDSRFIRHAATDRVRAAFSAPGASSARVSAYGDDHMPLAVAANHHGPVVWTQAFGSWGKTDGNGNAAELDHNTQGMMIGADKAVGDWRIGVLAGYSHTDVKARERAASGKSDNYHLGLYGGTQWDALGLRTGVAYTWHNMDTRRPVALPGLSDNPRAHYDAGTFQAFAELGYGMDAGAVRLEPFVNVAHVRLHTDGYRERGGAAGLAARSQTTDVTFTTLGLHAEHALDIGTAAATLHGTLGWRHALGDTTPKARHGFSAGAAFTVAGAPIAKDSAVIEAGVDLNLAPNTTFGLSYAGQLGSPARDHGVKANLTIRF